MKPHHTFGYILVNMGIYIYIYIYIVVFRIYQVRNSMLFLVILTGEFRNLSVAHCNEYKSGTLTYVDPFPLLQLNIPLCFNC